jgi:PD-(D/E)XK nuclease superfamily
VVCYKDELKTMSQQNFTNLFSALSKYSLKPKKTPLENFCTELLAWCLQNSNSFQKEFLTLINLDIIQKYSEELEIRTQQYWATDEDDEDEEENNRGRLSGFFDFEIQSMPKANSKKRVLAVIESKIGAPFGRDQLENYRAKLKEKATEYQQCYLITLTNHSQKPSLADAHIKWSQVHELLSKTAVEEKLTIIYKQFSDFLKAKGLASMNLTKINPNQTFKDGIKFAYQVRQLLSKIPKNSEWNEMLKNRAEFKEYPADETIWVEMYHKNTQPYFAVCFQIWPEQKMLVETHWIKCPNKPEDNFNKQRMTDRNLYFVDWGNGKGFGIEGKFTRDYDGNADKIKDWFYEAVDFALKLRKGHSVQ